MVIYATWVSNTDMGKRHVTHDKRHAPFHHLADSTKVKSRPRPKVTKVAGNIDKT